MLNLIDVIIRNQNGEILVEKLNLQIHNGDKIGIIGEEGNGKSTLLKAIVNPSWIQDYAGIEGKIIKSDKLKVGYFAQGLEAEWKSFQIYEYVLKHQPDDEITQDQYNELQDYMKEAKALRMDAELLNREQAIGSASGGEKVKLRLLKMLHDHPDVLLLDEPTNDLDLDTLEWLEDFILQCDLPILFISHDDVLLSKCANRIVHIEQRNHRSKPVVTVANIGYQEYVESRGLSIQKEAQLAKKEKIEYKKQKIKLNDFRNAVHDALNDTVRSPFYAARLAKRMSNLKAMDKRFDREGYRKVDTMEEAIDVFFEVDPLPHSKVILEYDFGDVEIGEQVLIKDVTLSIRGQDKLAIIGPNGCGKTVLMSLIYEQLKNREDIHIGYMPQDYAKAFVGCDSPIDYLAKSREKDEITRCRDLLGRMKFNTEDMTRSCMELSEGQKAKLCLLRFIKEQCNVLLLDEPTRNLSPLSAPTIRKVLDEFPGCIISISHDRLFLGECVDQIYEVKDKSLCLTKDIF